MLVSQPPRALDVPDMVSFVFKWGGLPDGKFIKRLNREFIARVPSDRVISGSVFKTISQFQIPITIVEDYPIDFIYAAIITHAVAEEAVADGVFARYITMSESTAMGSEKKRKSVLDYNRFLKRADALIESSNKPPREKLDLAIDIKIATIRHYLERKLTKDDYPEINDIMKQLVRDLHGVLDERRGADDRADKKHNVLLFDSSGKPMDVAAMSLENLGIKVGVTMHHNTAPQFTQFVIDSIDGSNVTMTPVGLDRRADPERPIVVGMDT